MNTAQDYKKLLSKELLSKLSHHSRSPFNGLLGFSELLLINQHKLDQEDATEYILRVNMLAKRAFLFSENVIFLMKILSENVSPVLTNVLLKGAIDYATNICKEEIILKKILFTKEINSSSAINADPLLLNSIFANLLSKAVKLADDESPITITESKEKNVSSIAITYKGMHIENETVLDFFSRKNNSSDELFAPENDIELWITFQLVKIQDLTLTISTLKDKSTRFKIESKN